MAPKPNKENADRDEIILTHMHIADEEARRGKRLAPTLTPSERLAAARWGIVEGAHNFNPALNVPIGAYLRQYARWCLSKDQCSISKWSWNTKQHREVPADLEDYKRLACSRPGVEEHLQLEAASAELHKAVLNLPENERCMLVRYLIEGASLAAIARSKNISRQAVFAAWERALGRLRKELG